MSSTIGTMFGINDPQSAWTAIATIPIFLWELSVGLWMTFKGFNRSAPIVAGFGPALGGMSVGAAPANG